MSSTRETVISLKDILNIIRYNRKKIIISAVAFSLFTTWWALTERVQYMAVGTFGEKSSSPSGLSAHFSAALIGQLGQGEGTDATTAFKSNLILGDLASRLNFQASIAEKGKRYKTPGKLSLIAKNLKSSYYQWVHSEHPIFEDLPRDDIAITSIIYDGETPYGGISLTFENNDTFVLKDGQETMRKHLGELIVTKNYQFKVVNQGSQPLKGRTFYVSFSSLSSVIKNLACCLTAKVDIDDKNLLNITFISPNRHTAALVVNTIMTTYSDFLKKQQETVAQTQLTYLGKRQKEMNLIVSEMMKEHATQVSSDLLTLGFPDAESAMEFLSTSQEKHHQRSLMIDLERMMLRKAKEEGYSHYENLTAEGDPSAINLILKEIRELNKQKDNIQLTLHRKAEDQDLSSFHVFLKELEDLKKDADSAKELLAFINNDELVPKENGLINNSKFIVSNWLEQLSLATSDNLQNRETIKQQFAGYLQQMIRLFDVHQDILQERMSLQQNPHVEYKGIELDAAREIYIEMSKQVQELEAQALQNYFIIENIQAPNFEVGSLSSFLKDSVSQELITQISELSLHMNDYINRSVREKERLHEEVKVIKDFLVSHLKHSSQLLVLKQNLLKEKMHSLQEITLALLQQQISLLEKHLADYIDNRLRDLDHESEVITQHQHNLNKSMVDLPLKWSNEQMIKQQIDMNKSVASEISRLIETKNLTSNLELTRSAPMDKAFVPLKPLSPRLPLYIIFGLIMGAFFSISYFFCKTLLRGVPISKDNLVLSGYNFAGSLSKKYRDLSIRPLLDDDLQTLRAVIAFLPHRNTCQTLLVNQHPVAKYSSTLATLLAKQGFKVLYIDLAFNKASEKEGLLQYLDGSIATPKIIASEHYDEIKAGGASRFGSENVAHKRFKDLMMQCKKQYDWIVAFTEASPFSGETNELRRHFDFAVLTIKDETLPELPPTEECKNVTFIVI